MNSVAALSDSWMHTYGALALDAAGFGTLAYLLKLDSFLRYYLAAYT